MRRLATLFAIVAFALAIAPVHAATKNTIVLGAALSLSGPLANEGRLTKEGYDFWASYVNTHGGLRVGNASYRVAIRYADDASKADNTARLLEGMAQSGGVDYFLGPYGSATTLAAAAVAERRHIPLADSGGAADGIFNQGYRYTFGVLSPAHKYLVGIIELAVRRDPRPRTVAITGAGDPFSLEVQQGAVQSANDHLIKVVYAEHYNGEDGSSVTAAAAAIKAANPDMILNAGHLQDALQLHRALKEQHVTAKIYGYTVGPDSPEFRVSLGDDAQAVLGSAQWSPSVTYAAAPGFYRTAREYASAFTAVVGHAPDYHNAEATAAALAFQYAIQHAGTLDRERVRDAMAKLDVVTFFGLLKFDSRGLNVYKPMVVNQIQSGRLVTVYPYRLSNAKPIYPAPAWHYGTEAASAAQR
jgi:branched-chain amino acid transport system substrate-binding protein